MTIVAVITDPTQVLKILRHLAKAGTPRSGSGFPELISSLRPQGGNLPSESHPLHGRSPSLRGSRSSYPTKPAQ